MEVLLLNDYEMFSGRIVKAGSYIRLDYFEAKRLIALGEALDPDSDEEE